MNAPLRWFACAVAAPTILLSACALRSDWARRWGLDVGALPELQQWVKREHDRTAELDEQVRRRLACEEARQRVDDELLAGRIGLREAAARYHDLSAAIPVEGFDQFLAFPGDSDEERCCRQVIQRIGARLRWESPADAHRVTDALEAELNDYLRTVGAGQPRE